MVTRALSLPTTPAPPHRWDLAVLRCAASLAPDSAITRAELYPRPEETDAELRARLAGPRPAPATCSVCGWPHA